MLNTGDPETHEAPGLACPQSLHPQPQPGLKCHKHPDRLFWMMEPWPGGPGNISPRWAGCPHHSLGNKEHAGVVGRGTDAGKERAGGGGGKGSMEASSPCLLTTEPETLWTYWKVPGTLFSWNETKTGWTSPVFTWRLNYLIMNQLPGRLAKGQGGANASATHVALRSLRRA